MAIRAKELHVRAPRRQPRDDDLLSRYMFARLRRGWVDDDLRTCSHCGSHVEFEPDGDTGWSMCSACGALA
jgi:hypothetical protein